MEKKSGFNENEKFSTEPGSRGTRKERKMFHLNCTYNNAKDRFRLLNLLKLELPVES